MMQAAGNPLLAMLGGAPTGFPPQGVNTGKPASGFAALFAGVQTHQSGEVLDTIQGNPIVAALKGVLPVLDELKTAVAEAEGLPEGVAEDVTETLDQLSDLLGDLVEGKPLDAEKLAAFLPQEIVEALPLEQATPLLLVHVLQQATLSVVSDVSAAVTSGEISAELPQPINLGGLITAIAKIQAGAKPPAPGQHPVAVAARLGLGDTLSLAAIEITPEDIEGDISALAQTILSGGNAAGNGKAALPFGEFFQQVAASAAHAAGVIEIPRDMVQIIPEEVASALQATGETQGNQTQVQQAVRPDAPQAKFTQAVIGQLRSVDFQEGTTKVELNPRGLGNVEIEMKTNIDGSLSVVVRAESAHVLSSLREESDLLAQIIAQGGEASVDFQEFSSGDQQSFDEQAGLSGGAATGEGSEDAGAETSENVTIGNGQLDLMT